MFRAKAYAFGSLTGAFTALAVVACRRGRSKTAGVAAVVALCCGLLSVANEEQAAELDGHSPQ